MCLYSSLDITGTERERECVQFENSELAGSPFVSVKSNGLGNFLEQLKFYTLTAFGHLKSCEGGYHVSHTCTLRENSRGSYRLRQGKQR